jgi:hypothetical protein
MGGRVDESESLHTFKLRLQAGAENLILTLNSKIMKNFEIGILSDLSQIEVQEMDGGMYMLTDKASYNAQLQANSMIISFVSGFIVGLFDL